MRFLPIFGTATYYYTLTVKEQIDRLQEKYQHGDWPTFNLSEYRQYLKVKNVEISNP